MLAPVRRILRRRGLRPLLAVLPWALSRAYGRAPHYSGPQVARIAGKLGLKPQLLLSARAALCTFEEFQNHTSAGQAQTYAQLRRELADLFGIDDPDFTAETLRGMRVRRSWSPIWRTILDDACEMSGGGPGESH